MTADYLIDGPNGAVPTLILAHGAGQGMNSYFMSAIAKCVAGSDIRVVRFNFPYMSESMVSGRKRPPNPESKLLQHWRSVIDDNRPAPDRGLFIGGKSMGGRMASLIADEMTVDGLVCLGYPFHPPGKPERLRTAHLTAIQTPTLICQGERDTFGGREEIEGYALAPDIRFHWLADGDHSFKPRKASGLTLEQHFASSCRAILNFIGSTK